MRVRNNLLAMTVAVSWTMAVGPAVPAAQGPDRPPERPRVYGIAYVVFRVSNVAAAQTFYGGWLGLKAGQGGGCQTFAVGARQHVLIEPGLPAGQDERLVSVGLVTEATDRLAAYLRAKAVAVQDATRCGQRVVRVTDPEGHLIEFVGPPSAPPSASSPGASDARILHAGITVRDQATMDRFYAEILGFSEIWRGGRTDDVTDWINMKVPDGTEYLEYMLVGAEPLTRQRLGSLHHVALRVADMQVAYETVLGRVPRDRWKDVGSPRIGRNRRWQLNLFDPDGTRTELMEPYPTR